MKYIDWLHIWLENYIKTSSKSRTYEKYCQATRVHILLPLGDYHLDDLTPLVLQTYVTELLTHGNKRTGNGLSPNSVKSIISIIQNSLKTAHLLGYLNEYTANKIKYPKIVEKPVDCFSIQEQKKIETAIKVCRKEKQKGIVICLYTGLRIGELLALTWSDIDFSTRMLYVNKTCRDGKINGVRAKIIDAPKTDSSRRVIPISTALLQVLREMKKKSKCEYVIADGTKPVSIRSYQRTFELLLTRLQIPHKGFHSLRHTFATRALECGMDVKSLSEILGHKNATTTLNRYAHSMWQHKADMMNKLGKML